MESREMIDYIRKHTTLEENLIQLAEESAEVSQAALKLVRVLRGHITSVDSYDKASDHLTEELTDMSLVLTMMDFGKSPVVWNKKLTRWYERIEAEVNGRN